MIIPNKAQTISDIPAVLIGKLPSTSKVNLLGQILFAQIGYFYKKLLFDLRGQLPQFANQSSYPNKILFQFWTLVICTTFFKNHL